VGRQVGDITSVVACPTDPGNVINHRENNEMSGLAAESAGLSSMVIDVNQFRDRPPSGHQQAAVNLPTLTEAGNSSTGPLRDPPRTSAEASGRPVSSERLEDAGQLESLPAVENLQHHEDIYVEVEGLVSGVSTGGLSQSEDEVDRGSHYSTENCVGCERGCFVTFAKHAIVIVGSLVNLYNSYCMW